MGADKLLPVHPGEILLEEFMKPLGISPESLAEDLGLEPDAVGGIVSCNRPVTAETALRLSRCFGTSERFWLNLQHSYDLEIARDRLGDRLDTEVRVLAASGPHPRETA